MISEALIQDELLRLASMRDTSFCPSEAARQLMPKDWRPLMPAVRHAAISG
jgi:hypothetical protein